MAANMCWAPSHYPESHVQSSGVTRRCTLSSKESPNQLWHSRIDDHLKEGRYSPYTTRCRIAVASRFVGYLNKEHVALDRKSTRLNSSHLVISYAVFCLK